MKKEETQNVPQIFLFGTLLMTKFLLVSFSLSLSKELGFKKQSEDDTKFILSEEARDIDLLSHAKRKLESAIATYEPTMASC